MIAERVGVNATPLTSFGLAFHGLTDQLPRHVWLTVNRRPKFYVQIVVERRRHRQDQNKASQMQLNPRHALSDLSAIERVAFRLALVRGSLIELA